jgi:hypothetical protein
VAIPERRNAFATVMHSVVGNCAFVVEVARVRNIDFIVVAISTAGESGQLSRRHPKLRNSHHPVHRQSLVNSLQLGS